MAADDQVTAGRADRLVGFSMRAKIFGLAAVMLGLLLVVAALRSAQFGTIQKEIDNVASYLAPLDALLARVNAHVLSQELHFERLERHLGMRDPDETVVSAEVRGIQQRGGLIDEELRSAMTLADLAAREENSVEAAVEFARLGVLFSMMADEHQRAEELMSEILEHWRQGRIPEARALDAVLTRGQADFDDRLSDLLREMELFTERAVDAVVTHERAALQQNLIMGTVATVLGLLLAWWLTGGLVRPLDRLIRGTRRLQEGDLDVELPPGPGDELGLLTDAFNDMARELKRKQRLHSAFGRYVDPRVVSSLLSDGDRGAGGRSEVTVFLSDLAGFSGISELLTPDRLVELLNQYLSLAAEPIRRHHGVIDEIIGDAVQAFWGPPFSDPDSHARLACAAALEQAGQLVRLRRGLPDLLGFRKNLPDLSLRIGLASGEAVVGTIGSDTSRSYSVMGPVVMRAEELEGLNKRFGTDVLVSAEVRSQIGTEFVVRELGEAPKGKAVFELMGYTADEDEVRDELCERFAAGLTAWNEGRSAAARAEFEGCLAVRPGDGPSAYYIEMG